MKISMNVEADSINVLALNMGKIAVDVEGVEIDELINVINDNGHTLHILLDYLFANYLVIVKKIARL